MRNLPNGTVTLPSANRFLMPQVQFSEMLRLSSCASEDMMVISSSKKKNEGEVPQYYVEGNHEAIIPPTVFDNVQVLMQSRGKGNGRNSCVSIFSSKIRCGDCATFPAGKARRFPARFSPVPR